MRKVLVLPAVVSIFCVVLLSCKPETEYVDKIVETEKKDTTPPAEISSDKVSVTEGDSAVLLSWTNPSDEDFYGTRISFTPTVEDVTHPIVIEGKKGENSSVWFYGLSNDVEYSFSLVALDNSQNEAEKISKTATPKSSADKTPPSAVTNINAVPGSQKTLLSWTNPSDEDFYGVWISEKNNSGSLSHPIFLKTPANGLVVSELVNGMEYDFSVIAVDSSLNKSTETTIKSTPVNINDTTPPANVTNLSATNKGGAILLSWNDATDADSYGYEVSIDGVVHSLILQGKEVCRIDDLLNGTEYTFTVKSLDINGNKSEGTSVTATPQNVLLTINLTVPSDPDYPAVSTNPTLSNTSADVNVAITSPAKIEKAVWKAGKKNIGVKINELLADNTANTLTVDSTGNTTFSVTESGWYDIVAIDNEGHSAWEQIEVRTIDKAAPSEVQLPLASFEEDNNSKAIIIKWIDPIAENIYDSPLDHYLLSYTVNDDEAVTELPAVATEIQSASITVQENWGDSACLYITLKSVDKLGNISVGKKVQAWAFGNTINVTAENVVTTLENLTSSSNIVLTGEITDEIVENIQFGLRAVFSRNENIMVSLDMTGTSGITEIKISNCDNLVALKLPEGIDTLKAWAFNECVNLSSILLPQTLTTINQHAFGKCKHLQSIQIPSSVTEFAYRTFNESGLKEIVIPESVTDLGTTCFMDCKELQIVKILGRLTILNYHTFAGCSNLEEVELPNSITEFVGNNIFNKCYKLESITFKGTVSDWNNILKLENWNVYTGIKTIVCSDGTITL